MAANASFAGERGSRIAAIDAVRGVAIVAMVIYHTAFDLSARGFIGDIIHNTGWTMFARLIAGTFLAVVGVSLVLATRNGLDWQRFGRRFAFVLGGAILVSIATWWMDARTFVFFGILHEIALASVLALPFLRLPSWLVAVVATAVLALPYFFKSEIFDWPPLWWVGLSAHEPLSVDYVPVFPWFGVVLAGIVVGRVLTPRLPDMPLARWRPADPIGKAAGWAGRWSLVIYLIHQPLIYGALSAAAPLLPPPADVVRRNFTDQCVAGCQSNQEASVCIKFCGCMYDNLAGTDLIKLDSAALMTPEQRDRWDNILATCLPPIQGN